MIIVPGVGLSVLTMLLASYFVLSAITQAFVAFKLRPAQGWRWMLFDGGVSLGLGAFIIAQWPVSGMWAVGTLVGIRLIMLGWALMALGSTWKQGVREIEDDRTDEMERHIQTLTVSLQQTQLLVAVQSAAIVSLESELHKKVSASEVDPMIVELNKKMVDAREQMESAAKATRETWHKKQEDANKVFSQLLNTADEISTKLRKS